MDDSTSKPAAVEKDAAFDELLREVARQSAPRAAVSVLPPGTRIADKLTVERCLGAGGMGAVYAVRHELTRHRRALKLLHPERCRDRESVRRFLDEASAAGRVDSKHLVQTFDAGILPSGEPYLVMELLDGLSLRALLDQRGVLPVGFACELVAQAAEGVRAAHAAKVIHRDLKPDNLFVEQPDSAPFVKVLDFGISKFGSESHLASGVTADGLVFGTPAYMAPEQLQGANVADARSDVFALGAVLFECLAGESPYDAPTLPAISVRLALGQHTKLDALRPELPGHLVALVHRAIAHDPAQRVASAQELLELLRPYRVLTTQQPRVPTPEPAAATRTATRWLLPTLVVLSLLLVAGWQWWKTAAPSHAGHVPPPPTPSNVVSERAALPPATLTTPSPDAAAPSSATHAPAAAPALTKRAARESTARTPPSNVEPPKQRVNDLGLIEHNPFVRDAQ